MSSFQSLSERLAALQETTKQVESLISRLSTLKFQPGSVPLDLDDDDEDGEGNVMIELGTEIHQTLKETEEDLEVLEQEVRDSAEGRKGGTLEREKRRLEVDVSKAERDIKSLRSSFRKAQITAKRNLDDAQRAERALLLSSLANPSASTDSLPQPPRRRDKLSASQELSKEDRDISASSSVTAALRRTHMLLSSELSRSQFAHDTLRESNAALRELDQTYGALDELLSKSRSLVGALLKSNKSDTWYLESAFWLLVVTIGWLVFRRFIYGPAWWLVWVPLKLFYKAWMGVFVAVGLRGSRDGVLAEDLGQTAAMTGTGMLVGVTGTVRPSVAGSDVPVVRMGNEVAEGEGGIIGEVGKIIDESQQDEAGDGARQAEPPNPKKRMWEETDEVKKEEERRKDEL